MMMTLINSEFGHKNGSGGVIPPSYSATSLGIFSRMSSGGANIPTRDKAIWDRFINRCVANGNLALISALQLRAASNATDGLTDWKNTVSGSPVVATNNGATHVPNYGFIYNGTSSYVNTGFNPTQHGGSLFTQNDSFAGWFIKKSNSAAVATLGGTLNGSTRRWTLSQGSGINIRANGATARTYSGESVFLGGSLYMGVRSGTTTAIYVNGHVVFSTTAEASTLPPDLPFFEAVTNNAGSPTTYFGSEIALFVAGKNTGFKHQEFYNDLSNFLLELEGGYPTWAQLGIELAGQSNAQGKTEDIPSTQALRDPITYTVGPNTYTAYMRTAGNSYPVIDYDGTINGTNRGDKFGSELTLSKKLIEYYQRDLYMDKTAKDGAPVAIEADRDDFNIANAELYPVLRTGIRELHDKIHSLGKAPIIVLLWIQGERDTINDTNAAAWSTNFTAIKNQLAIDGSGVNYYIINKLNPALAASGLDPNRITMVRTGNQQVVDAEINARIMELAGISLSADNIHYPGPGYELIGNNAGQIIIDNWLK